MQHPLKIVMSAFLEGIPVEKGGHTYVFMVAGEVLNDEVEFLSTGLYRKYSESQYVLYTPYIGMILDFACNMTEAELVKVSMNVTVNKVRRNYQGPTEVCGNCRRDTFSKKEQICKSPMCRS